MPQPAAAALAITLQVCCAHGRAACPCLLAAHFLLHEPLDCIHNAARQLVLQLLLLCNVVAAQGCKELGRQLALPTAWIYALLLLLLLLTTCYLLCIACSFLICIC